MKKIGNCENLRILTASGTELDYTPINLSWPAHFEEGILLIKSPTDFDLTLQTTATCYSDNGVNKYQFNGMSNGMLHFNCNFNTLTDTISGASKQNQIMRMLGDKMTERCKQFNALDVIGCDVA